MKTDWQDDRGLSLTELMVVVVLLGVIIGAAWSVMFAVEVMSDTLTARAVATDEAQVFLDTIGKELRQANSQEAITATGVVGAGAFSDVQTRTVTFVVDLNPAGNPDASARKVTKVRYFVENGALKRRQASATSSTYPISWGTESVATTAIAQIDPSWSGSIFTYYSNNAAQTVITPAAVASGASHIASITAVDVLIVNRATWRSRVVTSAAEIVARIRAIGSAF